MDDLVSVHFVEVVSVSRFYTYSVLNLDLDNLRSLERYGISYTFWWYDIVSHIYFRNHATDI